MWHAQAYSRAPDRSVLFSVSCGSPAAWKALLLGARHVTLAEWSRASHRPALVRAVSSDFSVPWLLIVFEQAAGGVSTLLHGQSQ